MIRVTRKPDGAIVYEVDSERDLLIVQKTLQDGQGRPLESLERIPALPGAAGLPEHPRRLLQVLASVDTIEGDELRQRTGLATKDQAKALAVLSNYIERVTGRKFDDFFQRKRMMRYGQRIKVYTRTAEGERLSRLDTGVTNQGLFNGKE